MPATFKSCCQKQVYKLKRHFFVNKTSRKHQTIGIIVLTCKLRKLRQPAYSRTHTLMFVESHGNAVARPAHSYGRINLSFFKRFGTRMREIRIIATACTVRAKIFHFNPLGRRCAITALLSSKPA